MGGSRSAEPPLKTGAGRKSPPTKFQTEFAPVFKTALADT
jgi:hypothetical protein